MKEKVIFNRLVVRARGLGFYFLLLACLFFIIPSIWLIVCFFIPNNEMYLDWINLIIFLLSLIFWLYQLILILKKRKVIFEDTIFITYGQNEKFFPRIRESCENFIDYKCSQKLGAGCIEFKFKDNKKVLFHVMQFSKKQIVFILKEIQKRGGFQGIEIKI